VLLFVFLRLAQLRSIDLPLVQVQVQVQVPRKTVAQDPTTLSGGAAEFLANEPCLTF